MDGGPVSIPARRPKRPDGDGAHRPALYEVIVRRDEHAQLENRLARLETRLGEVERRLAA